MSLVLFQSKNYYCNFDHLEVVPDFKKAISRIAVDPDG